jgi:hypothetical protein
MGADLTVIDGIKLMTVQFCRFLLQVHYARIPDLQRVNPPASKPSEVLSVPSTRPVEADKNPESRLDEGSSDRKSRHPQPQDRSSRARHSSFSSPFKDQVEGEVRYTMLNSRRRIFPSSGLRTGCLLAWIF